MASHFNLSSAIRILSLKAIDNGGQDVVFDLAVRPENREEDRKDRKANLSAERTLYARLGYAPFALMLLAALACAVQARRREA